MEKYVSTVMTPFLCMLKFLLLRLWAFQTEYLSDGIQSLGIELDSRPRHFCISVFVYKGSGSIRVLVGSY